MPQPKLEEAQARLLATGRTVRVTLPARAAFNIDEFTKITRQLAERLGCSPCISGAACWFVLENDYLVDPAGKLEPVSGGGF